MFVGLTHLKKDISLLPSTGNKYELHFKLK